MLLRITWGAPVKVLLMQQFHQGPHCGVRTFEMHLPHLVLARAQDRLHQHACTCTASRVPALSCQGSLISDSSAAVAIAAASDDATAAAVASFEF